MTNICKKGFFPFLFILISFSSAASLPSGFSHIRYLDKASSLPIGLLENAASIALSASDGEINNRISSLYAPPSYVETDLGRNYQFASTYQTVSITNTEDTETIVDAKIEAYGNHIYLQSYNSALGNAGAHSLNVCTLESCQLIKEYASDPSAKTHGQPVHKLNQRGEVFTFYQDQTQSPRAGSLSFFNKDGIEYKLASDAKGYVTGISNPMSTETPTYGMAVVNNTSILAKLNQGTATYWELPKLNSSNSLIPIAIDGADNPKIILLEKTESGVEGKLYSCHFKQSIGASNTIECDGGLVDLQSYAKWSLGWHLNDEGLLYANQVVHDFVPQSVVIDTSTYSTTPLTEYFNCPALFSKIDLNMTGLSCDFYRATYNKDILVRIFDTKTELVQHYFLAEHDADQNGMGDLWQQDYPLVSNSPDGDYDADGLTNQQEYIHAGNPYQVDSDFDGFTDDLEVQYGSHLWHSDFDGDGLSDKTEAAMKTNPNKGDTDGDGVWDHIDIFPTDPTETVDSDEDGTGDNADKFPANPVAAVDDDEDGFPDFWVDGCVQSDASCTSNGGLTLDVSLNDTDNDTVTNDIDAFPYDPTETEDSDADGFGDNWDAFPNDASEWMDSDNDGVGNNADIFPLDDRATRDLDQDGMGDEWEDLYGLNTDLNDAQQDLDNDNRANLKEFLLDSDPSAWGNYLSPGEKKWSLQEQNSRGFTEIAIDFMGRLYVGEHGNSNDKARILSLNQDGSVRWQYGFGEGRVTTPVIGPDNLIYVFADVIEQSSNYETEYNLFVFSLNGQLMRQVDVADMVPTMPVIDLNGDVYFGTESNGLHALNSNGSVKWVYETGKSSAPVIAADGTILIAIQVDRYDAAVDSVSKDGLRKWRAGNYNGEVNHSPIIGQDGSIYTALTARHEIEIYALNSDGSEKWHYNTFADWDAPLVIGFESLIYAGESYKLFALNDLGEYITSTSYSSYFFSAPLFTADGSYLHSDRDGDLRLSTKDGSMIWSYKINAPFSQSISIGPDGTIYIIDDDGLHAIEGSGQSLAKTPWPRYGKNPQNNALAFDDGDGVAGYLDNCPYIENTTQIDSDADGIGDACDAFPNDATVFADSDTDGVADERDEFPNDSTEISDSDGDGVGDNADVFPNDATETLDTDGDGIGDNSDPYPNDAIDHDGMDAAWEITYGLNPYVDDAQQDLDNDNRTNLKEFLLGSDPSVWGDYLSPGENKWFLQERTSKGFTEIAIDFMGRLYVGEHGNSNSNDKARLLSLNQDGSIRWKYDFGEGRVTTPVIGPDNLLYVFADVIEQSSNDETEYNLFVFSLVGQLIRQVNVANVIPTMPVIDLNGDVYFGTESNGLHTLNSNGSAKWVYETGKSSAPVIAADGTILIAIQLDQHDAVVDGLSKDGVLKWRTETYSGEVKHSPIIAEDGSIYIAFSDHGSLYALNSDGSEKWNYDASGDLDAPLAIGFDSLIYAGEDNNLLTLNDLGELIASDNYSSVILTTPLFIADGSYVNSDSDGPLRLRSKEDSTIWLYNIGAPFSSSISIGPDGTIYIIDDYGLHAIEGSGQSLAKTPWPKYGKSPQNNAMVVDDGDGIADYLDNCPYIVNTTQIDSDADGVGDACDAFPNDAKVFADSDSDGVADERDEFPNDSTEISDSDGDGVGDNADAFPNDATETLDSDGDGIGDNKDAYPNDPLSWHDPDNDGMNDDWELLHGLDPLVDDSQQDLDNDNRSNLKEFLLGSDPSVWGDYLSPGEERWNIDFDGSVDLQPLVDSSGAIYAATNQGYLCSWSESGIERWCIKPKSSNGNNIINSPILTESEQIIVSDEDYVFSVNLNGEVSWELRLERDVTAGAAVSIDGTIYVGAGDGLYAINPDGSQKWYLDVAHGDVLSTPVISPDGGTVYIGSQDERLYALDSNGSEKWSYRFNRDVNAAPALLEDGRLVIANDSSVHMLSSTGESLWSKDIGADYVSNIQVVNNQLILSTFEGGSRSVRLTLYAFDTSGNELLSLGLPGKTQLKSIKELSPMPAIAQDGTLYIGHDDELYSIAQDGTINWAERVGQGVVSPILGADGSIYIVSDYKLSAIEGNGYSSFE